MTVYKLCSCNNPGIEISNNIVQCKSCGASTSDCSSVTLYYTEKIIQNQVRVPESQKMDVLNALAIGSDYLNYKRVQFDNNNNNNCYGGSLPWGDKNSLRNHSDRRNPSSMIYTNVSSRGNSVTGSITRNRPGSMTPGGIGVDVKHGSYDRYLGKLKSKYLIANNNDADPNSKSWNQDGGRRRPAMNNKSFRFSIVSNNCKKCNGLPL